MFASTKSARTLLNRAIKENQSFVRDSWTDKTSDSDSTRRSVSFRIPEANSEKVLATARQLFKDQGYTGSVPKLTVSYEGTRYGGYTYIRVIAAMS